MKSINNHCFQPIAPWTGKLFPPSKDHRHPQGGILCHITHAPSEHQELIGKIVWLVWRDDDPIEGWQEQIKIDMQFSPDILLAKSKGNLYPDKIDGFSNVSALEILASLSEHDTIEVIIEAPQVHYDKDFIELITFQEPTQILGKDYALITFICPIEEKKWRVRHFNAATKAFDGQESVMSIVNPIELDQCPLMITSMKNIHLSPLNRDGWYAYGEHLQNTFVIKGLEPRRLTSLNASKNISGVKQVTQFVREGNWNENENGKGTAQIIDLVPTEQQEWKEGESYLVLHLLAPFQGDKELIMLNYLRRYTIHFFAELTCFLRAGHFSFGIAQIKKEAFSGDLCFDITYHQVLFAHMIPRFSGRQKWHKFMGSIQTGSMFLRPTSDVIIQMPEFNQTYKNTLHPLTHLRSQLEKITALSRRGQNGEGGLHFDMINTCTRESSQALFLLLEELKEHDHLAKENNQFAKLIQLLTKMVQRLIPCEKNIPFRWATNDSGKLSCPVSESGIKKWIYAYQTRKLSFPKELQDKLIDVCIEEGIPFRILKSNMIGGYIDGVEPRKPNANVTEVLYSISKDLFSQMKNLFNKS